MALLLGEAFSLVWARQAGDICVSSTSSSLARCKECSCVSMLGEHTKSRMGEFQC